LSAKYAKKIEKSSAIIKMSHVNSSRVNLYKDLLSRSSYFKLVCGAGFEESTEVEYLTFIYTMAGCSGFDVSANPEIVRAAKRGIRKAIEKSKELRIDIEFEPLITVSVGMPGDHHAAAINGRGRWMVNCS